MSGPRIYTGAEALALRADVLDVCKGCGTAWDFDRRRCAECDGTTVLFVRHRLPADLAASVAHHEAHAAGQESLLCTLAAGCMAAIGRDPLPDGTHPAEAVAHAVAQVRLFADDVAMARDAHFARAERAEADRDRWRDALRRCAARCESSVATGPDDVDGMTREVLDELAIVDESYGSAQRVAEAAWEALGLDGQMPRVEDAEDAVCEAIETRGAAIRADRDAALAHAEELTAALREAQVMLATVRDVAEREANDQRAATAERDALRAAVREYLAAEAAMDDALHDGAVTASSGATPDEIAVAHDRSSAACKRAREASAALRALMTEAPDAPRALRPDAYAVSAEPSPAVRRAVEALGGTILTAEVRVWWHRGPDGEVRPMPVVTEAPDAR